MALCRIGKELGAQTNAQPLAKLSSGILGEVGEKYLSKIRRVELTWLLSLRHQGLLSIWLKPLSPLV